MNQAEYTKVNTINIYIYDPHKVAQGPSEGYGMRAAQDRHLRRTWRETYAQHGNCFGRADSDNDYHEG